MSARRFDLPELLACCALVIAVAFVVKLVTERRDEPEVEIAAVIERAATTTDPDYCTEDVTPRFLAQRSGFSGEVALASCAANAADTTGLPDSVAVSKIEVDGALATAEAVYQGGSFDGARLYFELIDAGGRWRLDRLVTIEDLDRRAYVEFVEQGLREPPFSMAEPAIECVVTRTVSPLDAELVASIVSYDPTLIARAMVQCDRPTVERLALETFASEEYGLDPEVLECAEAQIRDMLDATLWGFYGNPRDQEDLLDSCGDG